MLRGFPIRMWAMLCTATLSAALVGCGAEPENERVTQANGDRIGIQMSRAEVEAILGPGEEATPTAGDMGGIIPQGLTWLRWARRPKAPGSSDRMWVGLGPDGRVAMTTFISTTRVAEDAPEAEPTLKPN